MSIQEVKLTLEDLKSLIKKFGLTIEILEKVYCRGENIHERMMNRILEFENFLFEEYGIKDVDKLIDSTLCKSIERMEFKIEKELKEVSKKELVHELIFEIPIYINGELKKINIIKKGNVVKIESRDINICEKPEDVIIGMTSIYIKCNDSWNNFMHKLNEDDVRRLEKLLNID